MTKSEPKWAVFEIMVKTLVSEWARAESPRILTWVSEREQTLLICFVSERVRAQIQEFFYEWASMSAHSQLLNNVMIEFFLKIFQYF